VESIIISVRDPLKSKSCGASIQPADTPDLVDPVATQTPWGAK